MPLALGRSKTAAHLLHFMRSGKIGKRDIKLRSFHIHVYPDHTLARGQGQIASMALSNKLPKMQHKSSSDIFSFTGTCASIVTGISLARGQRNFTVNNRVGP